MSQQQRSHKRVQSGEATHKSTTSSNPAHGGYSSQPNQQAANYVSAASQHTRTSPPQGVTHSTPHLYPTNESLAQQHHVPSGYPQTYPYSSSSAHHVQSATPGHPPYQYPNPYGNTYIKTDPPPSSRPDTSGTIGQSLTATAGLPYVQADYSSQPTPGRQTRRDNGDEPDSDRDSDSEQDTGSKDSGYGSVPTVGYYGMTAHSHGAGYRPGSGQVPGSRYKPTSGHTPGYGSDRRSRR